VLTGKVDGGQGARGQLALAAAEELRVPVEQIQMVLGDTRLCPNDGGTSGSATTPRTVPAVRQAAAAVRKLLVDQAAASWGVSPDSVDVRDGKITHAESNKSLTYAEVAKDEALAEEFAAPPPRDTAVTPTAQWKTLGSEQREPNARDKVLGRHQYPSDIRRPDMLYGSVLRSPKYRRISGWRVCGRGRADGTCRKEGDRSARRNG
jgi:isoquinoline 1-oxidoreductase beta subunit